MTMVETRHYLERGEPVEVLVQWKQPPSTERRTYNCPACGSVGRLHTDFDPKLIEQAVCADESHLVARFPYLPIPGFPVRRVGSGPRNVLIRRADGTQIVRPARGLIRNPVSSP